MMAEHEITIASTTDTQDQVNAAVAFRSATGTTGDAAPAEPVASPTETPAPVAETPPAVAEPTGPEAEPPPEDEGEESPQQRGAKTRSRAEERVREFWGKAMSAEARAKAKDEENDRLRSELEALRNPPEPASSPSGETPKVGDDPKPEDFETYEAYIAALMDRKLTAAEAKVQERIQAALAEERGVRMRETQLGQYQGRLGEARDRYTDFDAVTNVDLPVSPIMTDIIVTMDVGPDLSYWLGKHPEECERIAKMSDVEAYGQMRELAGQIRAQRGSVVPSGTTPAKPAPATVRTITNAPTPVTPVRGGTTATSTPPDQMNFQDYKAWRESRRRV
jgi:hypothetical protein